MSSLYDSNKHKKLIITKANSDSNFYPDDGDKYRPSKYFLNNLYSSKDSTSFDISVPFAAVKNRNYDNKLVYSANTNFAAYSTSINYGGPHWINRNSLYDLWNTNGLYSGVYPPELDGYNWHYLQNVVSSYTETQGTAGGGSIAAFNFPIAIAQKDKTQFKLYPPIKVSNTDVVVSAVPGTEYTDICVSATHSFSFRLGYEGIISGNLDNYISTYKEKPKWQQWCILSIKGGFSQGHACTDGNLSNRTLKYMSLIEEMNTYAKEHNHTDLCITDIRKLKNNVYYICDMNFNTYNNVTETYLSQPSFMSGGEATFCSNGSPKGFSIYYINPNTNDYYCYGGSSAHYDTELHGNWFRDDFVDYVITKKYNDGTVMYASGSNPPTQTDGWSEYAYTLYKMEYNAAQTLVSNLNENRPDGANYSFNYTYQPSRRTLFKNSSDASNIISEYHTKVPQGYTLYVNNEMTQPGTSLAKNANLMPIPEIRWLALNYYIKIL